MISRDDPEYEGLREAALWNGIVPDRYPDAIARPSSGAEVAELVRTAGERRLRIAIKSGGHNWRGAFLRDGGLLLDLGGLNRIEVDTERRRRVEPGATHQVLADALVPHALGFPIGHCPSVGLGGYLLAGGYGWNPRIWGPACWSVAAIDAIELDGEERLVDGERARPVLGRPRRRGRLPGDRDPVSPALQSLPRSPRCDRTTASRLPDLLAWSAELEGMPRQRDLADCPPARRTGGGVEAATVQASGFAESGRPP